MFVYFTSVLSMRSLNSHLLSNVLECSSADVFLNLPEHQGLCTVHQRTLHLIQQAVIHHQILNKSAQTNSHSLTVSVHFLNGCVCRGKTGFQSSRSLFDQQFGEGPRPH